MGDTGGLKESAGEILGRGQVGKGSREGRKKPHRGTSWKLRVSQHPAAPCWGSAIWQQRSLGGGGAEGSAARQGDGRDRSPAENRDWRLETGQFRVIGPGHPIRALVGDEVELPCRISPGKNATGMEVGWYRPPFSRVVHLYRNGKDQDEEQAPEYRGRTELLKETIGEGKVTLRIRHVRFSDEGGFTCFFRDHSYQEEAAMELKVEDPFYWINPGVLVLIAVLPVLLLQITVGLVFLCLQRRLRGKLRAEIENLHRTFDPHFLRVPCWKITLFVIVPVLGPLVALIICYNWLHRRLAGQFLEELRNPF